MSEEKLNNEALASEKSKIDNLKNALNKLQNKKSKFMFCVPDINDPVASIYEMYFHATVVKKMGYDVIILTEKDEQAVPDWIESELTDHKHISMTSSNLTVGPEDFMIIPEVFSNVMEQTKNLPCTRIALLQSIDYMLNGLVPGTEFKSFGVNEIITTSESLKKTLELFYNKKNYNIKTYDIGIPSYFKNNNNEKPKKPIISIIGRNANDVSKIVKLFYSKFPQYSWITFDPMYTKSKPPKKMRRIDFAKRLKENFASIWVDRISSFGTFPLECMQAGSIPICLKPDITPDYIIDKDNSNQDVTQVADGIGIWTENFYDIPVVTGELLIKFLDDNIDDSLYQSMQNASSKYTQENATNQLSEIYNTYLSDREKQLSTFIDSQNNLNKDEK